MAVLLDTNALLWLMDDSPQLGRRARALTESSAESDVVYVSAITFWEVAMLASKGRIQLFQPAQLWRRGVLERGIVEIPVSGEVAVLAVEMERPRHADPSDRIIAATALSSRATLITADSKLLALRDSQLVHDARS